MNKFIYTGKIHHAYDGINIFRIITSIMRYGN